MKDSPPEVLSHKFYTTGRILEIMYSVGKACFVQAMINPKPPTPNPQTLGNTVQDVDKACLLQAMIDLGIYPPPRGQQQTNGRKRNPLIPREPTQKTWTQNVTLKVALGVSVPGLMGERVREARRASMSSVMRKWERGLKTLMSWGECSKPQNHPPAIQHRSYRCFSVLVLLSFCVWCLVFWCLVLKVFSVLVFSD